MDDFPVLYDMHCHLGFCPDTARLARELAARGIGGFCCTVSPAEYLRVSACDLGPLWRCGLGAHPWWATEVDPGPAAELAATTPFIGEVGLDFGKKNLATRDRQVENLARITAAATAGTLLSLHAVRAADTVLDLLERTGALGRCTCVFHWYSDSNEALTRALAAGCYFSVGPLMLRSRRGREYARQLPLDRLLLETDYPSESDSSDPAATAATKSAALQDGHLQLAGLRDTDPVELATSVSATSERLLAL